MDCPVMNQIAQKQNEPSALAHLACQRRLYARAKCVVWLNLLLVTIVPLVLALCATSVAQLQPWVACYGAVAIVAEVLFASELASRWRREAALVQESFDCQVLDLEWNDVLCGSQPEATRHVPTNPTFSAKDLAAFQDWYTSEVNNAPAHLARLLCQLENTAYSKRLRRSYAQWLGALCLLVFTAVAVVGLAAPIVANQWVVFVLAPTAPFFAWLLREAIEQKSVTRELEGLDQEIRCAVDGHSTIREAKLAQFSRRLQDALFTLRSTNPVVFDFFYKLRRTALEAEAKNEISRYVELIVRRPHE